MALEPTLKVYKEISELPATIEPDSIYIVRVGAGFDMYVTDTTGAIAFTLNTPAGAGGATDIQAFTASGVWTKPTGAKIVEVYLVSGGGGGGSGRRGASLAARYGGGGGASGAINAVKMDAASLNATEYVWIGAGGNGGAAQTTNDANGNSGGVGASSFFGGTGVAGTAKISTSTGVQGVAGTSTAGSGTSSSLSWLFGNRLTAGFYTSGHLAPSTFGGAQSSFDMLPLLSGAFGGGISASDTRSNGQGLVLRGAVGSAQVIKSLAGGSGIGANGIDGELILNNPNNLFFAIGGTGGASGSTTSATPGGKGGKGGPGAGGGGGGASTNGAASGAGGAGGDGFCIVISYF